ncbi:MAG: Unknown protein [uncultured Sulfurovum sp.]|uniref:Uncharacterized protein n=1 Tax=uncultured Sulfurovum sp. TaxID=269237 RepID=A0A6S6S736_9BACT|nr:MAG: Unknown protein [uncultured Sulfurovum sp.]
MKNLILYIFLFSSLLFSNETCEERLTGENGINKQFMKTITMLKIDDVENTDHYISASSNMSSTGLEFLNFNTKDCTAPQKRKLKFYQAIVELFGLNKGNFIIPEKIANNNHNEKDDLFESLDYTPVSTPVIHENHKYTKEHIQNILAYQKIDIQDVDINSLQEKILDISENFVANETIGSVEKKLSIMLGNNIKEYKASNSLADSFFAIAENKLLYNNPSWLAMNFYDTIDTKSIDDFTSIPIVRSDLITSDMDSNKSYVYYMPKNNDKNESSKYHYFLAKDGNINPASEMEATLHYFFDEEDSSIRKERICQYHNRYILLKQLFTKFKVNKFPKDFNCDLKKEDVSDYKYNFVYVTSGEENSETYGHTMLHVYRGERLQEEKVENTQDDLGASVFKSTINKIKTTSSKKQKNIEDLNNSKMVSDDMYINFGVPDEESSGFVNKLKAFFGGLYGIFTFHEESTFLPRNYNNRMIIKVPITSLDKDLDKKLLLEAHLRHIQKHIQGQNSSNDILFKFPYKFVSKNCAYIMSDLIEVPLPHLREKFNKEKYFSFAPKDMFKLLEGEINVNQHQTSNP